MPRFMWTIQFEADEDEAVEQVEDAMLCFASIHTEELKKIEEGNQSGS